MARRRFSARVVDEAGNAIGGTPTEVRIYSDDPPVTLATVYSNGAAGATLTQPLIPHAGSQTTLTTATGTGDTTVIVADVTGWSVGQVCAFDNGTNHAEKVITAINAGTRTFTLDAAIGTAFATNNTTVGGTDQKGYIVFWVDDTQDYYARTKDVASGRVSIPTLVPVRTTTATIQVQEEGTNLANTRTTLNFISPFITATDNVGSSRADITGPTAGVAPGTSNPGDTAAEGTNVTIARSDHRHAREAGPQSASANLGADVALGAVGTFSDGPSVSLAAGTWLVVAYAHFATSASNAGVVLKLWDGTTASASAEWSYSSAVGLYMTLSISAIVSPGSTTTYKISATCIQNANTATIKAATTDSASGNHATGIRALKIA